MSRPSFLNRERPLFTAMAQARTPERFRALAQTAVRDGADAIGLQLEQLEPEHRNRSVYGDMIAAAGGLPVYATNYRHSLSDGLSDDALAEQLLELASCGATLCDLMGDYYDPSPMEISFRPEAVDRQKALVGRFHAAGAEVLMSSHVLRFLPCDRVLEIAKAHEARGADISKIVTSSDTEEELLANLETTAVLRRELKIPFLFLSGGACCRIHRVIGPMLGCCMWLCVPERDELATKAQPLLKSLRCVTEGFDR